MDCSQPHYSFDFPGKNTEEGCHFLLQRIFLVQESNSGLLHCRQVLYHWAIWKALPLSPQSIWLNKNSYLQGKNPYPDKGCLSDLRDFRSTYYNTPMTCSELGLQSKFLTRLKLEELPVQHISSSSKAESAPERQIKLYSLELADRINCILWTFFVFPLKLVAGFDEQRNPRVNSKGCSRQGTVMSNVFEWQGVLVSKRLYSTGSNDMRYSQGFHKSPYKPPAHFPSLSSLHCPSPAPHALFPKTAPTIPNPATAPTCPDSCKNSCVTELSNGFLYQTLFTGCPGAKTLSFQGRDPRFNPWYRELDPICHK